MRKERSHGCLYNLKADLVRAGLEFWAPVIPGSSRFMLPILRPVRLAARRRRMRRHGRYGTSPLTPIRNSTTAPGRQGKRPSPSRIWQMVMNSTVPREAGRRYRLSISLSRMGRSGTAAIRIATAVTSTRRLIRPSTSRYRHQNPQRQSEVDLCGQEWEHAVVTSSLCLDLSLWTAGRPCS